MNKHQLAYYATCGFYAIAGIGVIAVFGFHSLLLWQLIRSSIANMIITELRARLDQQDILYSIMINTKMSKADENQWKLRKALINLGYVLINVYTLGNLYFSVPSLKIITNLKNALDNYATLDMLLAEISYLYMQVSISVKSFVNMLEKALPVDCLLWQTDLAYQYNPTLLFSYGKTKTKEMIFGTVDETKHMTAIPALHKP